MRGPARGWWRVAPLLLGLAIGSAHAQRADPAGDMPIQHCVAADGTQIFTDRDCAAMNAAPAPADTAPPAPAASALADAPPDAPPGAAPPITCAGDIDTLKQAIGEAFARHDVTRLTGLMLWNGYGVGAVVAVTRQLAPLMHAPLLDVQAVRDNGTPASSDSAQTMLEGELADATDGAQASPGDDGAAPPAAVQVDLDGDGRHPARSLRFGVNRRDGCLWLRPLD